MEGQVTKHPGQVLITETTPAPIDNIPQELLRIYPKPSEDDNVVNKAIYRHLIKQYSAEKDDWPSELQEEFKSENKLLEYKISKSTGFCCLHKIGRWMARETTWARFWTLRVMFGPTACANQGWFEDFSREYPMTLEDAPEGIIPENFEELFDLHEWTPEEPRMERWEFHATSKTRYGKRKAVRVMAINRKKPKSTGLPSTVPSNTNINTAISTPAALEVKITMTARDERTNAALQACHDNGRRLSNGNQQHSQKFSDNINLMEEAIKQCSALHRAQSDSLEFLRSQMLLVKEEYRAKEKRLEELLEQERRNKWALEDRISRIEQAIKREDH